MPSAKSNRGGQRANVMSSIEMNSLNYAYNEDGFNEFIRANKDELKAQGKFNYEDAHQIFDDARWKESSKNLKKMTQEEAVTILRTEVPPSFIQGWFREANSDYKPKLVAVALENPRIRNASMNLAHEYYQQYTGKNISFTKFINSEVTVYRGGNNNKFVKNDVFVSYSLDKKIALGFGSNVVTKKVKIKDTLGSFQTNGEYELLVMNWGKNTHGK